MSAPAAIRATFSDFRTVRSRKSAQLILEIPIEAATAALNALGGVPNPAEEVWVAVARLNETVGSSLEPAQDGGVSSSAQAEDRRSAPPPSDKPKRRWDELPASQQAALTTNDPVFWEWLSVGDARGAAALLRAHCKVESRREFDTDPEALARWLAYHERFDVWRRYERDAA